MSAGPVIVGFLCNWCAYQALDRAGEQRLGHGADFRVIRVMCSGQVGPELILKAFSSGAHGVLIAGCRAGECHYSRGNIIACQRVTLLQRLLSQLGMPPESLQLLWVAASESEPLIKAITDMADCLSRKPGSAAAMRPKRA